MVISGHFCILVLKISDCSKFQKSLKKKVFCLSVVRNCLLLFSQCMSKIKYLSLSLELVCVNCSFSLL